MTEDQNLSRRSSSPGLSRYWGSVTVLPDGQHISHAEQDLPLAPIEHPRGYVGQRTLTASGPQQRT